MKQPDWSKAPEGATHAGWDEEGEQFCWYKAHEECYEFMYEYNSKWCAGVGRNPCHQPLIPRPYTGEGLPEVGEVVDRWLRDTGLNKARIKVTYSSRDVVCGEVLSSENYSPGKIVASETSLYKFRPIPRTITIGDMEVPEPVREPLEDGQEYYAARVQPTAGVVCGPHPWRNDGYDKAALKRGLIHLTKEAAITHAKALIKASGGEVE